MITLTKLLKIFLKNFKSFKRAEIPFADGFTAIAGANASGKSNILDAILFALGTTSLKSLRASKLTELVNHDATEGYAKVELWIKTKEDKIIKITRLIDKNGKSIYKIDDKKKTLNEIESLLLSIGISAEGHNIVVQGDITSIIEMNSKERLGIIKEAAGLQEFEEKKEEALKKLAQVDGRIKDVMLILNERENYLKKIEEEKTNALKYNALQEELRASKATILYEEIKSVTSYVETKKQEIQKIEMDIKEKKEFLNKLLEEEQKIEQRIEEITDKLIESGELVYSTFGKEAEQKRSKIAILEERISNTNLFIETKENRKKQIFSEIELLKTEKENKSKEIEILKNEIESMNLKYKEIESKIDEISPKTKDSKDRKQQLEKELSLIESELESLRNQIEDIRITKSNLEIDFNAKKNFLVEITERLEKLKPKIETKIQIENKLKELNKIETAKTIHKIDTIINEKTSLLNSLKGKREAVIGAIEKISKAGSYCPTCERAIDKDSKEKAISMRKQEEKKMFEEIQKIEGELAKLKEEKQKILEIEKTINELSIEAAKLNSVEEEFKNLEVKRKEAEKSLDERKIKDISTKENELYTKILYLEEQKEQLLQELIYTEHSEFLVKINELVSSLNTLGKEKSQKENSLAKISIEMQAINKKIKELQEESKIISSEIESNQDSLNELFSEKEKNIRELKKIENEIEKSKKSNKLLEEEKERLSKKSSKISEKIDNFSSKIEHKEKEVNEIMIEISKNEVRLNDLEEEFQPFKGTQILMVTNLNSLRKRIVEIEEEISKIGPVNLRSVENFEALKKEVDEIRQRATTLEQERKSVLEMISQIEERKLNVFNDCFSKVSKKFSELYYNFFNGEGLLELTNPENPLEGGLLIQAKYKEDTMKSIDAMSGGEKSLTALAFIFSIQSFMPAPFYILDEVDAALDKANSLKVGSMIKEQSRQSQFIVISHNDSVINKADQIIGVALNKKNSSVIGLKLKSESQDKQETATS
ncbi:MAG: AAA family ATPase [Candidatus Diapherotrites archaeon]